MSFVDKRVKYYPRYITDTTVISAITNPANWGSAMFTDPGVILDSIYPGQVYIGDDYRYEFNGLVLKRNVLYQYWDCTPNIVPAASSTFNTDGTAYWNYGSDVTISYDGSNKWMVATITNATQRINGAAGGATPGRTYSYKFIAKSPTSNVTLLDMSAFYANLVIVSNPTLTTSFQIYEYNGDALFNKHYLTNMNIGVGEELHIDNILICDIT